MGTNDEEFERLYKRYCNRLRAFLKRLGYVESPPDLAQDVFIRVYRNMVAYRQEAEWAYIETIARRLVANQIRDSLTKKRDRNKTVSIDGAGTLVDRRSSPETEAIEREQAAQLHDAIDRLSVTLRTPLLYQLGGRSYEEIAAYLGISVEAVKSRLHEARTAVRKMMEHP